MNSPALSSDAHTPQLQIARTVGVVQPVGVRAYPQRVSADGNAKRNAAAKRLRALGLDRSDLPKTGDRVVYFVRSAGLIKVGTSEGLKGREPLPFGPPTLREHRESVASAKRFYNSPFARALRASRAASR